MPPTTIYDHLPEPPFPVVILLGCQPNLLPPPPVAAGPCRVCGGAIRPDHPRYYCAQCDGMSPANERKARGARIGLKAQTRSAAAETELKAELKRTTGRAILTEHERRLIWNAYRGSVRRELADAVLGVFGATCRAFLIEHGQAPDWDLVLDSHGNIVGRLGPESETDLEAVA